MIKKILVFFFLFLCFFWRIWLAQNAKHGDMYNNLSWGQGAAQYGLSGLYELPQKYWSHSRPNQPPGSILIHLYSIYLSTSVSKIISYANTNIQIFPSKLVWWWEQNGDLISIKFPSILADFLIVAALLHISRTFRRAKTGIAVSIIYLIHPAFWYNSSFWGQTDPIIAGLSLTSIAFLFSGQPLLSTCFLGLSLTTKASWAPFVPLYLLYFFIKYTKRWFYLVAAPLVALAISLPFHPSLDLPFWLTNLFLTRILPGEYGSLSVNAFNFWHLIFGQALIPEATHFLAVPANIIGTIIVSTTLLICLIKLYKNPTPKAFLYLSSLIFYSTFLFASRMHERYLYPFFPLLAALIVIKPGRILWFIFLCAPFIYLCNLYYQWWAPGIPALVSLFTPAFTKSLSFAYLLVFALFLGVKSGYGSKN
jgi:hypothetical protein